MNEIEEKLIQAMPRIANNLQSELILVCPVDKGFLVNSIRVFPSSDGLGLVISMLQYGKHVEFGVPPHVIKPDKKKALKFKGDQKMVIVKKINHPGSRPNPFIRNTIQNKLPQIILKALS